MSSGTVVCQNLGPKEIRKRRLMGYLAINVGLVLAIIFVWQNVDDVIRVFVFIPFYLGYLGILQAIQKTCVFLALKGKQNYDTGNEDVVDAALKRKLRIRSYGIIFLALLLAGLCTYLTLAIDPRMMHWPQPPALPG